MGLSEWIPVVGSCEGNGYNFMSKRLRDSILSPIFHSYIFAMYKNESLWI